MSSVQTFSANFTPGAAVNVAAELAAVAGHAFDVISLEISQETTTTSGVWAATIGYSTAAATVWTTSTITLKDAEDMTNNTANTTGKAYSSGTSTDGTGATVRRRTGLNSLGTPYLWIPQELERLKVASGHFLFVKFVVAPPASVAFNINIAILEH